MNDFAQTEPRSRKRDEVAPHVSLPDPDKRRFPVGAVLVVAWIAVFLAIFIVLAQLKIQGPKNPGPVIPGQPPSAVPASPDSTPEPTPPAAD